MSYDLTRELLGEVSEHRDDDCFRLEHEPTGIELSLYGAEAGITVPYWYKGRPDGLPNVDRWCEAAGFTGRCQTGC